MTEILLRTTEFRNQKPTYLSWRPVGSVIEVIDSLRLRYKWIEIVCDLARPEKRKMYTAIPGYQYLCDHWSKELWDAWWQADRQNAFSDQDFANGFWEENIDAQLIGLLGKDPRGEVNLTDTWLWSEYERKNWFIVVNNDEEDATKVRAWKGRQETWDNEKLIIHPKTRIDYETNLSLSAESLSSINDKNIVVHPKFSSPVAKSVVATTDVREYN